MVGATLSKRVEPDPLSRRVVSINSRPKGLVGPVSRAITKNDSLSASLQRSRPLVCGCHARRVRNCPASVWLRFCILKGVRDRRGGLPATRLSARPRLSHLPTRPTRLAHSTPASPTGLAQAVKCVGLAARPARLAQHAFLLGQHARLLGQHACALPARPIRHHACLLGQDAWHRQPAFL